VVCSVGSCIEEIDTASTTEAVRKLNARKDVLVKDADAIDDIAQSMMTYSQSLAGDSVSPRQAERFFENLLSRSRAMSSARAELEEEILQLSRQIDALSSAEKKKEGKTDGEVSVVIMTKQPTDIQLRLTYRKSSTLSNVDFYLTKPLSLSCSKRDMVCGIRTTRHHRSRHTCTIGIFALPCPHHTKHRRRLDRRQAHTEYCGHGPI
jgi:hypothetical protein